MQWRRMGLPGKHHPGHTVLRRHRERVDVTSRRIVALKYRVDTVAFREAYVLLGQLRGWSMAQRLWFLGIVGQLYWSWPIISAVTLLGQRCFSEVCRTAAMMQLPRTSSDHTFMLRSPVVANILVNMGFLERNN